MLADHHEMVPIPVSYCYDHNSYVTDNSNVVQLTEPYVTMVMARM